MWSDAARAAAIAARQGGGSGGETADKVAQAHSAIQGALAIAPSTGDKVAQARAAIKGALAIAPKSNQEAAGALANGHPKAGLVGIHSASAISRGITKMRLAFHRTAG